MHNDNSKYDDLDEEDDWAKEPTYIKEPSPIFTKELSPSKLALKKAIDFANQQTVNDLFRVNKTDKTDEPDVIKTSEQDILFKINEQNNNKMKTRTEYIKFSKECFYKMRESAPTSLNLLSFCKTMVDECGHKMSLEHLDALIEHIHSFKDARMFKPIGTSLRTSIEKELGKELQAEKKATFKKHADTFGDAKYSDFNDDYLILEDKYS